MKLFKIAILTAALFAVSLPGWAQQGSTLYCGASVATAVPCGTTTTPVVTTDAGSASGGLLTSIVIAAASDNHANLKSDSGTVYYISVSNTTATVNYLRLYNAGAGFNGCNSATNAVGYWPIPASTAVGGREISIPLGLAFSTGISICVTGGAGLTDTTNANVGVSVTVGYSG